MTPPEIQFAADSPLEGSGFEPSVPLAVPQGIRNRRRSTPPSERGSVLARRSRFLLRKGNCRGRQPDCAPVQLGVHAVLSNLISCSHSGPSGGSSTSLVLRL